MFEKSDQFDKMDLHMFVKQWFCHWKNIDNGNLLLNIQWATVFSTTIMAISTWETNIHVCMFKAPNAES